MQSCLDVLFCSVRWEDNTGHLMILIEFYFYNNLAPPGDSKPEHHRSEQVNSHSSQVSPSASAPLLAEEPPWKNRRQKTKQTLVNFDQ
jgi:hypothetical protein